jgi:hypothetical protein
MENATRHIPTRRQDLTVACLQIVPDLWGLSFSFQGYGLQQQSMSWPWACFFGRKYFWVGHQMGGGAGLRRESQLARVAPPLHLVPDPKTFSPEESDRNHIHSLFLWAVALKRTEDARKIRRNLWTIDFEILFVDSGTGPSLIQIDGESGAKRQR